MKAIDLGRAGCGREVRLGQEEDAVCSGRTVHANRAFGL